MRKYGWPALLVGVLLLLAVTAAVPVAAGALTLGNYTYLFRGRDVDLPVDILTVEGTYLVPEELLAVLGLVPQTEGDDIHLRRGPVQMTLRPGAESARVDGQPRRLKTPALRISGRLFVPAELLPDLAFDMTVDGKFVLIRDYAAGAAPDAAAGDTAAAAGDADIAVDTRASGDPAFAEAWATHTLQNTVRGDGGTYGQASITVLTPRLLADPRLDLPWGTRMRLQSMLAGRTLLLITLRNTSLRPLSLDPGKLLLTGSQGHQSDYLNTEIAVDGTVTATLAPGAAHTSVLAYDQATGPLTLYYEGNNAVLGQVAGP